MINKKGEKNNNNNPTAFAHAHKFEKPCGSANTTMILSQSTSPFLEELTSGIPFTIQGIRTCPIDCRESFMPQLSPNLYFFLPHDIILIILCALRAHLL